VTSESLTFEIESRRDEVVDGEFDNRYRMAYRTISTTARNSFSLELHLGTCIVLNPRSILIG
jgi:hypothetical protein